jgi:phospholipid transport system substrate-binding protein
MKKLVFVVSMSLLMIGVSDGADINIKAGLPMVNTVSSKIANPEDFVNNDMQMVFKKFRDSSSKDEYKNIIENNVFPFMDWNQINTKVLGRYIRQFSPEEKVEFNNLFKKLILNSYVGIVDMYKSQSFSIGRKLVLDDGTVKIRVQLNGKNPVNVDYFLSNSGGEWRLFDVVVDGISFLDVYRSGFNQKLSNGTPADLIAQLHTKLDSKK